MAFDKEIDYLYPGEYRPIWMDLDVPYPIDIWPDSVPVQRGFEYWEPYTSRWEPSKQFGNVPVADGSTILLLRHKANKKARFAGKWIERISRDVARYERAPPTEPEVEQPPSREATPETSNNGSKVSVRQFSQTSYQVTKGALR